MKKICEFLKRNLKNIIAFSIGGILFGGMTVVSAVIYTNSIQYTKNGQSTVLQALDTLYGMVDEWDLGTPITYKFNGSSKPYVNDPVTPPSGKNIYLGYYDDAQLGVCIKRSGVEHCFRYNNWILEVDHIQDVFSDVSCVNQTGRIDCTASDFWCYIKSDGYVYCKDLIANHSCYVNFDESVYCS